MSEKPRKFTNGYYPSYNSNCDDKSASENSHSDHPLRFKNHSEEDVSERSDRLETKWNRLNREEKLKNGNVNFKSFMQDFEEEVTFLEDCMEENEDKIEEVKIYRVARWSSWKKMKKLSQYKDILRVIEVHGKLLKLLLSICKPLAEDVLINDDGKVMKRVKYLETVWHGVWLRAMEWECAIEQSLASRSDEEDDSGTYDAVDTGEKILRTLTVVRGSEMNVTNMKRGSEPEENLTNSKFLPMTSCHLANTSHSEITKSSQICDSDCLSSDSGFSDLSYEFNTCLVRDVPPICQTQTQKVIRKTSPNLQKLGIEKQKKKHIRTLKKTDIASCKQILFLSFLIFTFLILILIYNIKCFNNTCAIYISTQLQYYNGPPPI